MFTRLRMEGYIGGTGLGEVRNDAVYRLDHQVHIDIRSYPVITQGFADQRTDGQIRDIVIVHDIEMHDIRTGIQHMSSTSSPRRAKSADRMEGAIW